MHRTASVLALLSLSACIEQGLSKDEDPVTGPSPNILVDPPALAFDDVAVGQQEVQDFTVSNVGGAALDVSDVVVASGETAYAIVDTDRSFVLAPGDVRDMQVRFSPVTSGELYGVIQAVSNDADGRNSTVDLLGGGIEPNILVEPSSIVFGGLAEGDADVREFTVSNIGPAPLQVTDMQLIDGDGFEVMWSGSAFELGEGESVAVDVIFTPNGAEIFDGLVQVVSNDPDGDNSTVTLEGFSLGPDLQVTPASYDFGEAFIPCGDTVEIELRNVGAADLEITSLDYTSGGMLSLVNPLVLPLTLAPGDATTVSVDFDPANGADAGTLSVTSNDPDGVETAEQLGEGAWMSSQVETFYTPGAPPVDVLIAIDQSCSMETDNQDDVEDGFPAFVAELQNVSDWQLMLVTDAYTGCATNGVLDNTVPNVETLLVNNAFNRAHDDNGGANRTEKLLELADIALSKTGAGNCNEGFLRPGALLHIITISDEPEQSGTSAASWVSTLEGYASDPSLLKISGVLDLNNSCGTGASGYTDAVSITGGASLDICSSTWGTNFTDIASAVLLGTPTYALAQPADPGTVQVGVNGVLTTDFVYDPATQSVTVHSPAIGELDTVTVSYNVPGVCP